MANQMAQGIEKVDNMKEITLKEFVKILNGRGFKRRIYPAYEVIEIVD